MRRRFRAVLYDWDGTLVDSAETSFRCYQGVFGALGLAFDRADFERTYSPDWYRTYVSMGLPRERWADADALWLEQYRRGKSELVPGAREALRRVSESERTQGLVSSGDGERVRRELTSLGVEGFFSAVVCGGETSERKPDPAPLFLALGYLGVPPAEAAYVGDSPEDVEMARAAGVFSVGVPGGFPNREALVAAAPDVVARSLEDAVERLVG
jgi:phosphoglycolate phosphatase